MLSFTSKTKSSKNKDCCINRYAGYLDIRKLLLSCPTHPWAAVSTHKDIFECERQCLSVFLGFIILFFEYHQIWLSDVTSHPIPTKKNWWQVCRLNITKFTILCLLPSNDKSKQIPINSLVISCLKLKLNVIFFFAVFNSTRFFTRPTEIPKVYLICYATIFFFSQKKSNCDQAQMIEFKVD